MNRRDAQHVATALVEKGLRAIWTEPFVEAGEEHYAKDVRNHHQGDSIDGLVTFTAINDATGEPVAVVLHIAATPLGVTA